MPGGLIFAVGQTYLMATKAGMPLLRLSGSRLLQNSFALEFERPDYKSAYHRAWSAHRPCASSVSHCLRPRSAIGDGARSSHHHRRPGASPDVIEHATQPARRFRSAGRKSSGRPELRRSDG